MIIVDSDIGHSYGMPDDIKHNLILPESGERSFGYFNVFKYLSTARMSSNIIISKDVKLLHFMIQ